MRRFFSKVKDNKFFHPHPFTPEEASSIIWNKSEDFYCVLCLDEEVVAYGFLRGWDAGWEDKCVGLIVADEYKDKGFGRLMLEFLHSVAFSKGLERVRLHVDKDNISALALYIKHGYKFTRKREDGEYIGYKNLHSG